MRSTATDTTSATAETELARLKREQGRERAWLAGEMGVSYWRVGRLLAGEREMTLVEASRAALALGVPIETFLAERPGEKESES